MITVLGSINLDLFATADKLPLPGETVSGNSFATASGGKGANQALAVLRAGGDLHLKGAVGDDPFGEQALAELRKEGANLDGVDTLGDTTGVAVILVGGTQDNAAENVIVVVPGANGLVSVEKAQEAVAEMRSSDILLLQQEIPFASNLVALEAARKLGVTSILNTAPFTSDSPKLAALADIVVANETEFADLMGKKLNLADITAQIKTYALKHNQVLVVTLGADGTVAATPTGDVYEIPALKITPVDTVGAGDTFCGYLAASLNTGIPFGDALKRASIAGSLACLAPGAQPAIPHAAEVAAKL